MSGERWVVACIMDRASCDTCDVPKDNCLPYLQTQLREAQALLAAKDEALREARACLGGMALDMVGANLPSPTMEAHAGIGVRINHALSLTPADVLRRQEEDEKGRRLLKWLDAFEAETEALPLQHETPELGCCTYNWRMRFIRAARAALEEVDKR